METIDKKTLSERDICTKYITPAIVQAGWNLFNQIQEEVTFTKGRVMVKGRLWSRGESKRVDFLLSHKPNIPVAVIEARSLPRVITLTAAAKVHGMTSLSQ